MDHLLVNFQLSKLFIFYLSTGYGHQICHGTLQVGVIDDFVLNLPAH